MSEKLISMKVDPKEREKRYAETAAAPMEAQYPYGLQIQLDEEALDKLGLEKLPKVEGTVLLYAKAEVTSVSSNESTGGGKRRSISLQITHLCLETSRKAAGDVLFGQKGD